MGKTAGVCRGGAGFEAGEGGVGLKAGDCGISEAKSSGRGGGAGAAVGGSGGGGGEAVVVGKASKPAGAEAAPLCDLDVGLTVTLVLKTSSRTSACMPGRAIPPCGAAPADELPRIPCRKPFFHMETLPT